MRNEMVTDELNFVSIEYVFTVSTNRPGKALLNFIVQRHAAHVSCLLL